jgi:phosphoglycolate phosphatase
MTHLIFDVDGTLVDSREDIAGAQQWVFHRLGAHSVTKEQLYPHIGKTLTEVFRMFLPEDQHHRITEAMRMYLAHYRPRALDTTTLFPGVEQTLAQLHGQKRGLAVATTKSTVTATRVLTHLGIVHYFDPVQGTDDTPPKPDPYVLNQVLKRRSWAPESVFYIGDSEADLQCAQNAGVRSCIVTYGALDRASAERLKPDVIIESFRDVMKL